MTGPRFDPLHLPEPDSDESPPFDTAGAAMAALILMFQANAEIELRKRVEVGTIARVVGAGVVVVPAIAHAVHELAQQASSFIAEVTAPGVLERTRATHGVQMMPHADGAAIQLTVTFEIPPPPPA